MDKAKRKILIVGAGFFTRSLEKQHQDSSTSEGQKLTENTEEKSCGVEEHIFTALYLCVFAFSLSVIARRFAECVVCLEVKI